MRKIKRVRSARKTPLVTPAFLPGRRGAANWHITDAGDTVPSTLAIEGIWNVPFGDEVRDKYIRLHELLHAAHSPMDAPVPLPRPGKSDISVTAILLAEEVRIDGYARGKLGIKQLPPENYGNAKEVRAKLLTLFAKTRNPQFLRNAIEHFFASWMSNPQPLNDHYAQSPPSGMTTEEYLRYTKGERILEQIWEHVYFSLWSTPCDKLTAGEMVSWDWVIKLADYIQDIFDNINEIGGEQGEGEGVPDDLKDLEQRAKADQQRKVLDKIGGAPDLSEGNKPIWGKMKKRIANLSKKLPGKKTMKSKWKATDMGVNPRNIHRLTIDQQVFGSRRRIPGGSVLIDDSGSMHWKSEELERIVEAAPASIIAAYSGTGDLNELVIVAQDQKWADVRNRDNRPAGGGNVVDLPAIEWLAEQPEPRIWVTDGAVVPLDGNGAQAARDCMAFAVANNINVVRHAAEAAEVFEGKRAIYR